MPPHARAAAKAGALAAPPQQLGTFARLRAQAARDLPTIEAYVLDDVDPPIEIGPPDTLEQQITIQRLFDRDGNFALADAGEVLEVLCGEAFPRVWDLLRNEHVRVSIGLIQDIGRHFEPLMARLIEAGDFPGGSGASPT
jgi:hypothetical protein